MKKLWLFLVILGLAVSVAHAAAPTLWVTAEIRGLQSFAEQVERLAADFDAPMTQADFLGMIGGVLMAPALDGIDKNGTIRIYVMEPAAGAPGGAPRVAFSLPVEGDGQVYLDSVASLLTPGEKSGDVEVYSAAPGTPAMIQKLCVVRLENRLLLAQDEDTASTVAGALKAGELPGQDMAVSGTLALSVAGRTNADRLEPLLNGLPMPPPTANNPADPGRVMKAQFGGMLALLRQVENLMIGLRANEISVTLSSLVEPVAGSVLERVMGELRAPSAAFSALVPANALAASAGCVAVPDEFLDAYAGIAEEMYSALGDPWTGLSKALRETVEQMKGQFLGEYAFAVVPGNGLLGMDFIQAFAVKDPAAMQAAMQKMVEAMQEIKVTEGQPLGMKLSVGEPREYDGVSVTTYKYEVDIPAEAEQEIPAPVKDLFKNMQYEMAFVGQTMLYCLGSPESMNRLIDSARAGEGASIQQAAPVRALLPDLPKAAVDIHYIRIMDLVRTAMNAVPELPADVLQKLPAASVTLAGYSVAQGRDLASFVRLSHTDLKELGAFFRSIAPAKPPQAGSMAIDVDESMQMEEEAAPGD